MNAFRWLEGAADMTPQAFLDALRAAAAAGDDKAAWMLWMLRGWMH